MNEQRRIVVGVDGSPSSKAALAWAVGQASLTGARIDAVIAWQPPVAFAAPSYAPIGSPAAMEYSVLAEKVLGAAISEIAGPSGHVIVSPTVHEGNPAKVLLEAAIGADLLVVGSRGHGGFAEALVGSVSQHCVHHATCPVVIIRGARA